MLGRVNTKKTTPTHNITKLLKTKTKVLKAVGRKTKNTHLLAHCLAQNRFLKNICGMNE